MTGVIIILVVLVLLIAAVLVFAGIRRSKMGGGAEVDPLEARLAEFSQRGDAVSLEEIELSQPFTERVVMPLVTKMGELSSRFTPQHLLETTNKQLELAGNPGRLQASAFLSLRFVGMVGFGGIVGLLFLITHNWPPARQLITTIIFAVLGFFFPQLWLTSKIQKRQKEVRKAMPDALDLLTICVEAGLGFDAAMSKVNEKWDNELSMSFGRVIREVQLGKLRREALRDMAERIGIPEMTSFTAAIIQSEVLGVSMAKVLRIQADQMRMKRRQRAEEEAHKAPIKMLLPLVGLIFPTILIVLMTPAILKISKAWKVVG
jgi:tight adherence protein C